MPTETSKGEWLGMSKMGAKYHPLSMPGMSVCGVALIDMEKTRDVSESDICKVCRGLEAARTKERR